MDNGKICLILGKYRLNSKIKPFFSYMKKLFIASLFAGSSFMVYASGSDSSGYYVSKAVELSRSRKILEADKNFQKALILDPSNNEARLEFANHLVGQRKYFPAVEQYGKVLQSDINNNIALQKMTELSFLLRRWNDVLVYGNKLMAGTTAKDVKYMLGKSYYELENYGQAQKFLREAIAESPSKIEAVTTLGKVLIELSNYNQAIEVYKQTLQLDPGNNQLIYELGLLYFTVNNEKEAVKYFEAAAEKGYKTDLDYYENLGLAYLGFDMIKGIANLQKVLDNKPGNPEILFQIAQAYFHKEQYQEAADTYYKVYENDAYNSRALYMTGLCLQKKGDKNKGIALCEKAISMDPGLAHLKTQKFQF